MQAFCWDSHHGEKLGQSKPLRLSPEPEEDALAADVEQNQNSCEKFLETSVQDET